MKSVTQPGAAAPLIRRSCSSALRYKKENFAMTAFFVFVLPFAVFGIACGAYFLGCFLAQAVPGLWARFCQRKKGR